MSGPGDETMQDKPPSYEPAAQSGYPPQQAYPPQQGYPAQSGYPPSYPAQQGYPPQQGYPAQQPGYPPQAAYNQQQGVVVTTAPQSTVIVRSTGIQPNDHLIFAIIVTIFCCLPFGIVGIIKALDVRNRWAAGDTAGAEQASRAAKKWSLAGLIIGIILEVVVVVIIIVYYVVIAASFSYYYG